MAAIHSRAAAAGRPHPYPTMVLYDAMIQSHGRNIYHSDCGVRPGSRAAPSHPFRRTTLQENP